MNNQIIITIIAALKDKANTLKKQKEVETKLLNYFRYTFNTNEIDAIEVQILEIILATNEVNNSVLDRKVGKATKNRLTTVKDTLIKYLGAQKFEQSNIYPYFFSQMKIMDLGLADLFKNRYKKLLQKIEEEPYKVTDTSFPYNISFMKYEFERNKYVFDSRITLQDTIDDFKIFTLTQSLYFKCVLIMERNPQMNTQYIDDLIESIEKNTSILQKNDFLELYYFTYQLLKSGQKHYADKVRKKRDEMRENNIRNISNPEYRKISMWLIEYYNFVGDLENMSNMYENLEVNSLLLMPGHPYIQPQLFKNIVTVYLRLKKYEKARAFIEDYQNKLPINERKYYTYYANGIYYFYTEDFEESKKYLEESLNNAPGGLLKRTQPLYLNTSTLLIRTYIELITEKLKTPELVIRYRHDESLALKLDALKAYLRKKKIPSTHPYSRFLSLGIAIKKVIESVLYKEDVRTVNTKLTRLKNIEAPTFVADWFAQILQKLGDVIG